MAPRGKILVHIYTHNQLYDSIKIPYIPDHTAAYIREQVLIQHPELKDTNFRCYADPPKYRPSRYFGKLW